MDMHRNTRNIKKTQAYSIRNGLTKPLSESALERRSNIGQDRDWGVWSNRHNDWLSLVWQPLSSSESEKRCSSCCLTHEQGYLLPCQSGCIESLPWYARCWLEIDRSMIRLRPKNVQLLEPLCASAATLPTIRCIDRFLQSPIDLRRDWLVLWSLAILLPEARLQLVQYNFAVSAIWLCG